MQCESTLIHSFRFQYFRKIIRFKNCRTCLYTIIDLIQTLHCWENQVKMLNRAMGCLRMLRPHMAGALYSSTPSRCRAVHWDDSTHSGFIRNAEHPSSHNRSSNYLSRSQPAASLYSSEQVQLEIIGYFIVRIRTYLLHSLSFDLQDCGCVSSTILVSNINKRN